MDETYLTHLFGSPGNELQSVKVIRNKQTGFSEGYGFVDFASNAAAQRVLQAYNGQVIPGTTQVFRLNWAAHGVGQGGGEAGKNEFSIFVGDLAPDVTDYTLQEFFRGIYSSVRSAKVVTDAATGRPKGYGFVRFGEEGERDKALSEMNGQTLSTRVIRVSLATPKKVGQHHGRHHGGGLGGDGGPGGGAELAPNTTLFIGALSSGVTEDDLQKTFGRFGELVYTRIPANRACGFVQFAHRKHAEAALAEMNGQPIGGSAVRISWGKNSGGQHAPAHYGGGPPQPLPQHFAGYPGYATPEAMAAAYGGAPGPVMGYYQYDPGFYAAAYGMPPPQALPQGMPPPQFIAPSAAAAAAAAAAAGAPRPQASGGPQAQARAMNDAYMAMQMPAMLQQQLRLQPTAAGPQASRTQAVRTSRAPEAGRPGAA